MTADLAALGPDALSQTKPAQFGTCKTCKRTIYAWDLRSECGKHQEVGILHRKGSS